MSAEDYIFEDPMESYERSMEEPDECFQKETEQWFNSICDENTKPTLNINIDYIRLQHTTKKDKFFVID